MLQRLLSQHALANLCFALVLVLGALAYTAMPRAKDPDINFNWIQIFTFLPGASAEDVERKVTQPLEEALRRVQDIKFVASSSRENVSSILVRFNDIGGRAFDRRLNDLRREVTNKAESELPEEAETPIVTELTTANALPTATLAVTAAGGPEALRRAARNAEKDIERLTGVDNVLAIGLDDPELIVDFDPAALTRLGVRATALADTVAGWYRDVAGGKRHAGGEDWLLRIQGADEDPARLGALPITGAAGEVRLDSVANVYRGRERPAQSVYYQGQPAVMLWVLKKASANVLDLVSRLNAYSAQRNALAAATGVRISLVDDQTEPTRNALGVMHANALFGLLMVLAVTWLFLGSRIALLTTLGIPFAMGGAFIVLYALGFTLNNSVLLGVVIVLGMLVDDAVVVAEGIHLRLRQGSSALEAGMASLREVAAPVTAAVLTTMAAFLPLMLMPGIVGHFLMVAPLVVTLGLLFSLLEAFWMLPAHVAALRVGFDQPSRLHVWRTRFTHRLQVRYGRVLVAVMRHGRRWLAASVGLLLLAALALAGGAVRVNFFAFDPIRLFYVDVTMPPGTPLERTAETVRALDAKVRAALGADELRDSIAYAGEMLTETEPLFGDHFGQVLVSLQARNGGLRDTNDVVAALKPLAQDIAGPLNVRFWAQKDGPPTYKAIVLKVRGDRFEDIRAAADEVRRILAGIPGVRDIGDDDSGGTRALTLRPDTDAARRAGLPPLEVMRLARLYGEGEIAAALRSEGDRLDVRVRAKPEPLPEIDALLRAPVALPGGGEMPLAALVQAERSVAKANVRHYNFRRAITVDAELDKTMMDTPQAVAQLRAAWDKVRVRHPDVDLEFGGELDDIQESLDALLFLFLLGVGLIYMILGAQFNSYFQPLMILATVPMAFVGVVAGLLVSGHPLSLFTLYGVVALAGVAVNSAIVMIAAANERLARGMSVTHAILYAARRRVVPILITSVTTIMGLFSLASGIGGKSLLWGPVATAIVWGLGVSTLLTLFLIPLLYRYFMGRGARAQ